MDTANRWGNRDTTRRVVRVPVQTSDRGDRRRLNPRGACSAQPRTAMAATSSTSSHPSRRARRVSLGAFGAGGLTAWVWLAVASTTAIAPVQAQYSPPPSAPSSPLAPAPLAPPPDPAPVAAARDGVHAHRAAARHAHGPRLGGCCERNQLLPVVQVVRQHERHLPVHVGAHRLRRRAPGAGDVERDLQGVRHVPRQPGWAGGHAQEGVPRHQPRVPGVHRHEAHGADAGADRGPHREPAWRNTRRSRATTPTLALLDFVVGSSANYKCLKQRSSAGMPSHPRLKILALAMWDRLAGAWTRPQRWAAAARRTAAPVPGPRSGRRPTAGTELRRQGDGRWAAAATPTACARAGSRTA